MCTPSLASTPFAGRERVWGHTIEQVVQNGMRMWVVHLWFVSRDNINNVCVVAHVNWNG